MWPESGRDIYIVAFIAVVADLVDDVVAAVYIVVVDVCANVFIIVSISISIVLILNIIIILSIIICIIINLIIYHDHQETLVEWISSQKTSMTSSFDRTLATQGSGKYFRIILTLLISQN